ncbi:hypothetical protein EV126DRAFT_386752 [Verticillium dahliae]|nr:hypothetical protein EV126DRAFT_386752 [Verticillium dahliae]
MEALHYYMLSFYTLIVARLVARPLRQAFSYVHVLYAQHLAYPLLVRRQHWTGATRWEALAVLLYAGVNIALLLYPFSALPTLREVERQAGVAAFVNLVPLSIVIRTNVLTSLCNVPLGTVNLVHHWIGRVAIAQALLHAFVVLALRPRPGAVVASGYIGLSTLMLILPLSVSVTRRRLGRYFFVTHLVLAISALAGLVWHAYLLPALVSRALITVGCSCWIAAACVRAVWWYRQVTVRVLRLELDDDVALVTVHTNAPIRASADDHFNIYFPASFPRSLVPGVHGHAMKPLWFKPGDLASPDGVRTMSFLMARDGTLASQLERLVEGAALKLDGPYGQKSDYRQYEDVMLVAKGAGISGVLPYALQLAERRKSDSEVKKDIQRLQQEETELMLSAASAAGEHQQNFQRRLDTVRKERTSLSRVLFQDKTQRVDLLWMLENEKQERWTAGFFSALQRLDPNNRLLVVWCLYPGPRTSRPRPFQPSDYWKCTSAAPGGADVMEMMTNRIREKSTRTRGEMIVINCGDPDFTMRMRAGVIAAMGGRTFIEFVESEYQPRSHRPIDAVVAGQAGGRGAGKRVWAGKRNAA